MAKPKKRNADAPTSGIEGRRRAALAYGSASYKVKREGLIRVAASVFNSKGYEATTLNDVASALGIDRASLYYYIGSKEDLLQEIVHSVLLENVSVAEKVRGSDRPTDEKIRLLFTEMMESFDRNYPFMYVYLEDLSRITRQTDKSSKEVLRQSRQFEAIVLDILEEGKQQGTFRQDIPSELFSLALFGMVNWTHRWYKPNWDYSPKEIAQWFADIFLSGALAAESQSG